jgi:hypothetical protein
MEEHEPAGYHWYRGFCVTPCLPTTGIVAVIITVSTPRNFTTEKNSIPSTAPIITLRNAWLRQLTYIMLSQGCTGWWKSMNRWVQLVLRLPATGRVYTGSGTVLENLARGLPMVNPSSG